MLPCPELPNSGRQIEITLKNYRSIKSAYLNAVSVGDKEFVWQDNVLLTVCAKHMLEHMRTVLGIIP